ncbi:ATP phosphoribosyltransferase regulatory subunit [hydrothermal vent metagenome]|uniref:ATP phosphoribosyltransferase regulatory subunit n=1 Tax=hydrothermal vent metagenome TaxID=652676 RepID=A0A3B0ZYX5_9ZZZZ
MKQQETWILPEGIEEILPPQAKQLDSMSRQLLDLFYSWGYELVMPPFIEYLESLLKGTASDLDLQTFKITDQITGRMMGIRADMTPQVARIDSHHLSNSQISRLCYLGTVLHTKVNGLAGSRSPMQLGVELYGHKGIESDIEMIQLMLETLNQVGIKNLYLDIGHVGVYRELVKYSKLTTEQESELFDILNRKSKPELTILLESWKLENNITTMISQLIDLNGGIEVVAKAKKVFSKANKAVLEALNNFEKIVNSIQKLLPDINLHCDLAELRGYHYHTGVVFSTLVAGQGDAIAWGGRYDNIAAAFDNPRPATGFSTDLKKLMSIQNKKVNTKNNIMAPYDISDKSLQKEIKSLRLVGECVITQLPNQKTTAIDMGCDRVLEKQKDAWIVSKV